MRKPTLWTITALCGALACNAGAHQLGRLGGGLSGGLSGGLPGGLGGVSGTLGGSLNGRLNTDSTLDAADRAAAKARADTRRAQAAAKAQAQAQARGAVAVPPVVRDLSTSVRTATTAPAIPVPVIAAPVIAAPVIGLAPGEVRVVRQRQSAALVAGGVEVLGAPESYVYMDRQADELRHELAGTGVEVTRQGETIVLAMPSDVTFAFDKSDIRPRFHGALSAVARTLNRYPATYVDVIGHTDAVGSVAYNQRLSERRAESVADFIQDREEIPARLYVAGHGKSEPVASNATIEGRAANRRVEILLHPYVRG